MWVFLGLVTLFGSFLLARATRREGRWEGEARSASEDLHYRRLARFGRNRRGMLSFALPCMSGLILKVKPETGTDRLFNRLGISREFQTGVGPVDEAVYILAEDPRLESLFQGNPDAAMLLRRIALTQIRGANFDQLLCIDGQLSVRFRVDAQFRLEAQLVDRVLPLLKSLAVLLETVGGSSANDRSRPFAHKAALVLALNGALLVTGLLHAARMWFAPVLPAFVADGWLWAAAIGGVSLLILVLLAWRWLGRSSRAHLVMLELALMGPIGCVLSGHFMAWQINGLAALSGPMETLVIEDYRLRGPSPRIPPYVSFMDWPGKGDFVRISISRSLERSLQSDGRPLPPIELELRRGPLGPHMVHAIRAAPERPDGRD